MGSGTRGSGPHHHLPDANFHHGACLPELLRGPQAVCAVREFPCACMPVHARVSAYVGGVCAASVYHVSACVHRRVCACASARVGSVYLCTPRVLCMVCACVHRHGGCMRVRVCMRMLVYTGMARACAHRVVGIVCARVWTGVHTCEGACARASTHGRCVHVPVHCVGSYTCVRACVCFRVCAHMHACVSRGRALAFRSPVNPEAPACFLVRSGLRKVRQVGTLIPPSASLRSWLSVPLGRASGLLWFRSVLPRPGRCSRSPSPPSVPARSVRGLVCGPGWGGGHPAAVRGCPLRTPPREPPAYRGASARLSPGKWRFQSIPCDLSHKRQADDDAGLFCGPRNKEGEGEASGVLGPWVWGRETEAPLSMSPQGQGPAPGPGACLKEVALVPLAGARPPAQTLLWT